MLEHTFSYYKKGDYKNKAIVFLHGFLEDATIWESITKVLATHYYCLAIDLLGHGKTPCIAKVHTMELMASQLMIILQKEDISHCTLIGHSMGGYVALAFAEQHPEMVDGLVLMNSTPLPDSEEKKTNRDRVLKVIDKDKELFVRTAVTNLFAEKNRILFKEALEKLITIGIITCNEGISAAAMGMKERPDRTAIFEKLLAKKHIIIGENDTLISPDYLINLANRVGGTYTLLSGGHLSYIENEKATIDALEQFMEQI